MGPGEPAGQGAAPDHACCMAVAHAGPKMTQDMFTDLSHGSGALRRQWSGRSGPSCWVVDSGSTLEQARVTT